MNDLADLVRPLVDDEPISIPIDRTAQLNPEMPLPEPLPLEAGRESGRYSVHADRPYYEGRFPPRTVTSIVFLDACREDSGPFQVWLGSHTADHDHERVEELGLDVPPEQIDHGAGGSLVSIPTPSADTRTLVSVVGPEGFEPPIY